MKLIFALAAAGFVSTLTVPTPASAQKALALSKVIWSMLAVL
jgi:hypothetical protein